jgi:hypothetical protein
MFTGTLVATFINDVRWVRFCRDEYGTKRREASDGDGHR